MAQHSSTEKARTAPDPDHPDKPQSPTEMTKPSWKYVLGKTFKEFLDDDCLDLAAALTYRAVLALFPALIALVSLLGLVGNPRDTVDAILAIITNLGQGDVVETLEVPLRELATNQSAGLGLLLGLALALFSASGYVNAFSRAMNRIYEVDEGRPIIKLRLTMLVVTIIALLLVAVGLFAVVVSSDVARAIGDVVGLGGTAVTVWSIAKWPILAGAVVTVIALMYYATPNVKQPKIKWMSMGAFIAIVVWVLASLGLGLYVSRFGNYDATYGTLAGVIVGLLWLWITNNALLFGAEFDAEAERGRQLQAGIAAEETLQLPPRDTRASEKKQKKEQEDVERAKALRLSRGTEDDLGDVKEQLGGRTGGSQRGS